MAKYFEDFTCGEEFVTPARTVTEADIVQFAGLSGDYNSIHTDEEYAKKSFFGKRVAHGLLVLAIMSGLWVRLGVFEGTVIAFYGIEHLRFTKPVFIGDTISLKMRVKEKKERDENSGIVTVENLVINQRNETVLVCDAMLLVKRNKNYE
ncbi:MAG: MaoC/PaaZ C-terminal domain-containing protein [Thermoplasmata archaeon]